MTSKIIHLNDVCAGLSRNMPYRIYFLLLYWIIDLILMDISRPTQKVSVNAFSRWSAQLQVETSRTGGWLCSCSCAVSLWIPEPRCTVHRYRHMYGNQDEWEESRLHDQWGCRALFNLTAQKLRPVCGAATGGGESPTGLFKQWVD